MFKEPLGKTMEEVDQEVSNGRFPPCFLYKIIYTGQEENRVKSNLLNVVLQGANGPLSFSCTVEEEMCKCVCGICVHINMWYMCLHVQVHVCIQCSGYMHACVWTTMCVVFVFSASEILYT